MGDSASLNSNTGAIDKLRSPRERRPGTAINRFCGAAGGDRLLSELRHRLRWNVDGRDPGWEIGVHRGNRPGFARPEVESSSDSLLAAVANG